MNTMRGTCLCGEVAYEITGRLGPVLNCHCSKCRRWHGAAYRARTSVDVSQFAIVRGTDCVASFKSSELVTKHFCRICGSPLHSTYDDRPTVIGIGIGALEGVQSPPEAHIFTGSKASWHIITDTLPQHEEWPGSEAYVRQTNP